MDNTRPTPSVVTDDGLVERLDYVVKMARQYEAAVMRVPDAVHGAGERLEQAKRELLAASDRDVLVGRIEQAYREGHRRGRVDGSALEEDQDWLASETRAALIALAEEL